MSRRSKRDYKTELEEYLTYAPRAHGARWELVSEHRFHPVRQWRFDWCWVAPKIAIEYDGIMYRTVGHNSLAGILRDSDKINEAQRLGWRVFRANAKTVKDGTFFELIDRVLSEEVRAA